MYGRCIVSYTPYPVVRKLLVQKTFDFLGQYIKVHEVDIAVISQFQYKQEATTYESFLDQGICICQGSMKSSGVDHLVDGILVLVQKGSNVKKKVFAARNLDDLLPSLPLTTR